METKDWVLEQQNFPTGQTNDKTKTNNIWKRKNLSPINKIFPTEKPNHKSNNRWKQNNLHLSNKNFTAGRTNDKTN